MGATALHFLVLDVVASAISVLQLRGRTSLKATPSVRLESFEEAVIATDGEIELDAQFSVGSEPDYGSGPYLHLMARAVRLARSDMANPVFSAEARAFLRSDMVALFAECLGYEGRFDG